MAKRILFLLLSTFLLASGQTPDKDSIQRTSSSAKALIDLEQRWVDGLQKADAAILDSVLDDTFIDTDEMGHRSSKKELFAVLKSGDLKMKSIKLSGMRVHEYGSAAVVTGRAVQAGNFKGQALTNAIVFTDTFIMQKGQWKAVASHRSPSHDMP